jgi:hypothetical protein
MRLFTHLVSLVLFVCLSSSAFAQADYQAFKFKEGDLLFQDLDCGGLCDAIEKVTLGAGNRNYSHIGLVCIKKDTLYVIEAIGKDVHLTPIDTFINRQKNSKGKPKITVGRLKKKYQNLNSKAIVYALNQTGTPYDDDFGYNNGKYYCSELIYDAYKTANNNKPFFRLYPMTFKDPATGETFPAWTDYYKNINTEIPEGKPGCNPGGISTSDKIEILASFY